MRLRTDSTRRERFSSPRAMSTATRDTTFTVDKFFISPGLDSFEQRKGVAGPTVAEATRAFLRRETAFDDPEHCRE